MISSSNRKAVVPSGSLPLMATFLVCLEMIGQPLCGWLFCYITPGLLAQARFTWGY